MHCQNDRNYSWQKLDLEIILVQNLSLLIRPLECLQLYRTRCKLKLCEINDAGTLCRCNLAAIFFVLIFV